MKCPKCQTENRDSAQFCRVCGQSLSSDVTCTECGHVNLHDSKFCDKCGHTLGEPTQQTPGTQPFDSAPSAPLRTSQGKPFDKLTASASPLREKQRRRIMLSPSPYPLPSRERGSRTMNPRERGRY